MAWSLLVTLLGYALGIKVSKYINYVTLAIIVVSLVPIGLEILRSRRKVSTPA